MSRRAIMSVLAALLGIAAAAAVAWAGSQLSAQRIGLAAEPLSVASGLAPATTSPGRAPSSDADAGRRQTPSHRSRGKAPAATTPTATSTPPPVVAAPTTAVPVAPTTSSPVTSPPSSTSPAQSAGTSAQTSRPRSAEDQSGSGSGQSSQRDD